MCMVAPRPASRLNSPRGASARDERPSGSSADPIPPAERPEAEETSRIAAKAGFSPLYEAKVGRASATGECLRNPSN
jgi:hypothetical protein